MSSGSSGTSSPSDVESHSREEYDLIMGEAPEMGFMPAYWYMASLWFAWIRLPGGVMDDWHPFNRALSVLIVMATTYAAYRVIRERPNVMLGAYLLGTWLGVIVTLGVFRWAREFMVQGVYYLGEVVGTHYFAVAIGAALILGAVCAVMLGSLCSMITKGARACGWRLSLPAILMEIRK